MLKKTITFEDFNEEKQTETLYFNITRTEGEKLIDLQPRLQKWLDTDRGDRTELTIEESREFFNIIKELVKVSYGVRSEDGKHFRKSPEIFADFESSAMYDAVLFSFIQRPQEALGFMVGILPKGLDDEALTKARNALNDFQNETKTVVELPQPAIADAVDMDTRPPWVKEDREPTKAELTSMTPDQLQEAFRRRSTNS